MVGRIGRRVAVRLWIDQMVNNAAVSADRWRRIDLNAVRDPSASAGELLDSAERTRWSARRPIVGGHRDWPVVNGGSTARPG